MNEKTTRQIEEMKKQTIGVEIEMNSITRDKAAKIAATYFGKKTDKAGCEHELMSNGELYGAAKSILGTEENLDMEIYLHIEKTISYNDRIEFYMKEGGKKVWQRQ